jgi:hypothetical protein
VGRGTWDVGRGTWDVKEPRPWRFGVSQYKTVNHYVRLAPKG